MSAPVDPSKRFTFIDKRELASVVGEAIAPVDTENPLDGVTPDAADGKVSLRELYRGGLPIKAIDGLAPNTVLVMPLRKPETSTGGIVVSVDENKGTLGTNCLAYVVVGVGENVSDGRDLQPSMWLEVEPGDCVVLRNGMLEPLHPDLEPLAIHRMHLLARVRLRD